MAVTHTWLLLAGANLGLGSPADLLGSVLPLLLLLPAHLGLGFDDALKGVSISISSVG